jgi:hypothetical protein
MTMTTRWLATVTVMMMTQIAAPAQDDRIGSEEREALVALYNATGGAGWVNHEGWLGPPGSECHWYGVLCGLEWKGVRAGRRTVQVLELPNNGLAGSVPSDLSALTGLRRLVLRDNAVNGPVPERLLQRFDEGDLEIDPLSLIHNVDEIVFDLGNPSMFCSGYKVKITANGSVHLERRLCRNGNKPPQVYCEHRDGKTYDFDMLGRFLIRSGFFSEAAGSSTFRGSDMGQVNLTAKRGSAAPVSRTWIGPTSIANWSLALMLEGIVARTDWSAPPTNGACSGPISPPSGVSP